MHWILGFVASPPRITNKSRLNLAEIFNLQCASFLTEIDLFQDKNVIRLPLHNRTFGICFVTNVWFSTGCPEKVSYFQLRITREMFSPEIHSRYL